MHTLNVKRAPQFNQHDVLLETTQEIARCTSQGIKKTYSLKQVDNVGEGNSSGELAGFGEMDSVGRNAKLKKKKKKAFDLPENE